MSHYLAWIACVLIVVKTPGKPRSSDERWMCGAGFRVDPRFDLDSHLNLGTTSLSHLDQGTPDCVEESYDLLGIPFYRPRASKLNLGKTSHAALLEKCVKDVSRAPVVPQISCADSLSKRLGSALKCKSAQTSCG